MGALANVMNNIGSAIIERLNEGMFNSPNASYATQTNMIEKFESSDIFKECRQITRGMAQEDLAKVAVNVGLLAFYMKAGEMNRMRYRVI